MIRRHSADYQAVLSSERWRALRLDVIRRAGYRCESCGRGGVLDVHQACGYANLGNEQPEELQSLCRDCHDAVHRAMVSHSFGCLRSLIWIVAIAMVLETAVWLLGTGLHQVAGP